MREVIHTFFEALVLVILVVFLFLGSFRATLIPVLAIPVSLVGTFAFFVPLGFTINTLTLFGLVLAIGIVVDDAIVVVEAVEQHMRRGLDVLAATEKAMEEVSGPVVGIALVLSSVFVPVAFLGGITGELYRQFALTLSISVLLSALAALTLTPALCRLLLRPREGARGPLGRLLDGFDRRFEQATGVYLGCARAFVRRTALALLCLGVVTLGAAGLWRILPSAFVPGEDQGMVLASVTLPEGVSADRTDAVMRRGEAFLAKFPAIENVITLGSISLLTGESKSSTGTLIATLKPWDERKRAEHSAEALIAALQRELDSYPEAMGVVFSMPPIPGIGAVGGFQFELQDRKGSTPEELAEVTREFLAAASQRPELAYAYSGFNTGVPMVDLELDRDKSKLLGLPLRAVYGNLQTYLGSMQVNTINLYGRMYRVVLQAEPEFRLAPGNIGSIYVRGEGEEMIPLSTLLKIGRRTGAGMLQRYNLYRSAEISGSAAPGRSSGEALEAMDRLAEEKLPQGFGFEWTGLSYQEKEAGRAQGLIFALALVFVFLVLAALYESWAVPFGVLLGLPLGIFGAFLGTALRGIVTDVYVQIGIVMLLGLSAKNAILIVEFARRKRQVEKVTLVEAALAGARLRFRPILMTSFAFILGVAPLMFAEGAGAAARRSLGTAVCTGMLAATVLGVLFIPGFSLSSNAWRSGSGGLRRRRWLREQWHQEETRRESIAPLAGGRSCHALRVHPPALPAPGGGRSGGFPRQAPGAARAARPRPRGVALAGPHPRRSAGRADPGSAGEQSRRPHRRRESAGSGRAG